MAYRFLPLFALFAMLGLAAPGAAAPEGRGPITADAAMKAKTAPFSGARVERTGQE